MPNQRQTKHIYISNVRLEETVCEAKEKNNIDWAMQYIVND